MEKINKTKKQAIMVWMWSHLRITTRVAGASIKVRLYNQKSLALPESTLHSSSLPFIYLFIDVLDIPSNVLLITEWYQYIEAFFRTSSLKEEM
jgi:hypothetical protein